MPRASHDLPRGNAGGMHQWPYDLGSGVCQEWAPHALGAAGAVRVAMAMNQMVLWRSLRVVAGI